MITILLLICIVALAAFILIAIQHPVLSIVLLLVVSIIFYNIRRKKK